MFKRTALAMLSAWMAMPGAALADAVATSINIDAGALSSGLDTLEKQTGAEILFDPGLVNRISAPAVRGRFTEEQALQRLIAGANLNVRHAQSGAWIVEAPDPAPLAKQDAPVDEILVIGRRTQNTDIRRTEMDVQPYNVTTRDELVAAHRDNIEQYFQSRITTDTSIGAPFTTSSHLDLRGLGAVNTLVLIDGRRMPGLSVSGERFDQPDLNAIPLHAIERIETLTGAAGGIHGFGALGGVVNVVLDRNARGLDIYADAGISSRGDAFQRGLEISYGATTPSGDTDISIFAATSRTDSLQVGQRDFALRDRAFNISRDPSLAPQFGNSLRIVALLDATNTVLDPNLTFKPEFGGGALPANATYLPTALAGDRAASIAALTQHAGEIDASPDGGMARSDLGANPEPSSLFFNLRHRFGHGLEAYFDAVALHTDSQINDHSDAAGGFGLLTPDAPQNPFADTIFVFFPIESGGDFTTKTTQANRYTAGLMGDLPFGWRGTAEFSLGSFNYDFRLVQLAPVNNVLTLTGDPSDPDINPFGDWDVFQSAIAGNISFDDSFTTRTRFRDQSLRLAGPLFSTAAGATTLTLLAQHRTEHAPIYTETNIETDDGVAFTSTTEHAPTTNTQTSFYAEVRSPIFADTAPIGLLRGLEVQLAVRHDQEDDDFTSEGLVFTPDVRAHFSGTAYTVGAKVTPAPWLMLRTSYATGRQVPPLNELIENTPEDFPRSSVFDPMRPGEAPPDGEAFTLRSGGFAGLQAVDATTFSLGGVLTPFGDDGPNLTLDFSRIRRTGDPDPLLNFTTVLAHEDFWPERVQRGPLTNADRALGYTGGPILGIDTRTVNSGELKVDTLDMRAEWPIAFLGGRLRFYGEATYQIHNLQRALFETEHENVGYALHPLKWRANGGLDWSNGAWSLGANLQYFDSYFVYDPLNDPNTRDFVANAQGSRRVASQSYLDLYATWRIPSRHDVTISLGAINVLDTAPPRQTSVLDFQGQGFSQYGDPRMRRFAVTLSSHF